MQLVPVEKIESLPPEIFREQFDQPQCPVVITGLAKTWPAFQKWNWSYFKTIVGDQPVGIYNNNKSDAYTPVNRADEYTTFGEYLDMIQRGPAAWRIFLFNIFSHAPQLTQDFTWPNQYMKGFIKRVPMLFVGGQGSITHMHFDIDLSRLFHTQFAGRKRVLLFPYTEQYNLYRKPFEVLSLADFSNYFDPEKSKLDLVKFPAVKKAKGYEVILEPGDTLYMPGGYWHHMEYLESGFAMSLRALHPTWKGKLQGAWNIVGMRNMDTLMKKMAPDWWYQYKQKKINRYASFP